MYTGNNKYLRSSIILVIKRFVYTLFSNLLEPGPVVIKSHSVLNSEPCSKSEIDLTRVPYSTAGYKAFWARSLLSVFWAYSRLAEYELKIFSWVHKRPHTCIFTGKIAFFLRLRLLKICENGRIISKTQASENMELGGGDNAHTACEMQRR